MHRAGDIDGIDPVGFAGAGEIQHFLRPGRFWLIRPIVEHIPAVDHEPRDLQDREPNDRDQNDRNDADITKRFHAARPLALLRSEKACAAAATALADDTLAAGASGSAAAGRAALAIFDNRRITPSLSASWPLRCADICIAAVSWLPRFSLTSRTVCFSPPIARSAISVAVISSPMVAFSECSSAFKRCKRLLSSMQ